jgi:hypothetical protein
VTGSGGGQAGLIGVLVVVGILVVAGVCGGIYVLAKRRSRTADEALED